MPAVKVGIFGIQHTPPGAPEEGFDMTMVVPASGAAITDHGPGDPAELSRAYQRQLVSLIHELLGRPRPRDTGPLVPIAVLGEEGNWALRRARGDDPEHPPFESAVDFIRALRTQTFVSRTSPPPMVRVQSLKIPARLLTRVRNTGTVLTLTPVPQADGTTLSTRVVARRVSWPITGGRGSRHVVSAAPRRNDELTRRLSKIHCYLRRRGGRLMALDSDNSNGTELDGRRLSRDTATGEPLPESGAISLDTRFIIDFRLLPGSPSGRPQIDNLPQWAGAATASSGSSPGSVVLDPAALGGMVFEPRSPATMRRAVWLLSGLAFGCDPSLALYAASADGLRPVQGYVHHHLGHFWLENLDGNGAVVLDGIMLGANEIAPLTNGLRLRIGASEFVLDVE